MRSIPLIVVLAFFGLFLADCAKDPYIPTGDGYPREIGEIITNQCATAGCHNNKSKAAAGGLNLETWDDLFAGSRGGSPVVPYRPDQSFFQYFINSYEDMGVQLSPTMPYNQPTLSKADVQLFEDWITDGAPNADGFVKFSDNPNRRKVYNANQGCDMVGVLDADTKTIMRYIDVGNSTNNELPHMVKVSPDGQHWYVIFAAGDVIQKYRTSDDSFVAETVIGMGSWNTFMISDDSQTGYMPDLTGGNLVVVNLANMSVITNEPLPMAFPHGTALSPTQDFLYITAQVSNFIYKIDLSTYSLEQIRLAPGEAPSLSGNYRPHEIIFSPDGSRYYVTCQGINEVRVLDAATDLVIDSIPTGTYPSEFALAEAQNLLFVSCMEDLITFPGNRGSVAVIDLSTGTVLKYINTGTQPHAMAVDAADGVVYVSNRNVNTDGPAPHHVSDCGGRNGYITLIDLSTLELVPDYKFEVSTDPYSLDIRK